MLDGWQQPNNMPLVRPCRQVLVSAADVALAGHLSCFAAHSAGRASIQQCQLPLVMLLLMLLMLMLRPLAAAGVQNGQPHPQQNETISHSMVVLDKASSRCNDGACLPATQIET